MPVGLDAFRAAHEVLVSEGAVEAQNEPCALVFRRPAATLIRCGVARADVIFDGGHRFILD